ncbi:MAG: hypothetical protein HUJ25_01945 [Crocinitomicaceae bacterium]|nr:hypothetical protein [Crocinitomicaceae bacterium]
MRKFLLSAFCLVLSIPSLAQTESENHSYSRELVRRADCKAMQTGYVFDAPLDANAVNNLRSELYLFERGIYAVRFSSDRKKVRIDHISYVRVPNITAFLAQLGITCTLDYSSTTVFKDELTNETKPITE